jgi:hypothetical protein
MFTCGFVLSNFSFAISVSFNEKYSAQCTPFTGTLPIEWRSPQRPVYNKPVAERHPLIFVN